MVILAHFCTGIVRMSIVAILSLIWFAYRDNVATMKTATFYPETVASFLKRRKIATLGEIGEAMGSASKRTVFRNLSRVEYLSSYSHRGKFYTLRSIAKFSREGLWSLRSVWFSRFGTLLATVVAWVERSEAGYDAAELTRALHVESKHALTRMVRQAGFSAMQSATVTCISRPRMPQPINNGNIAMLMPRPPGQRA